MSSGGLRAFRSEMGRNPSRDCPNCLRVVVIAQHMRGFAASSRPCICEAASGTSASSAGPDHCSGVIRGRSEARPVKCGARFSRNAATPSRPSPIDV